MKCPGQDTLHWGPGAIFDTECPDCGRCIEFFTPRGGARDAAQRFGIPGWISDAPLIANSPFIA